MAVCLLNGRDCRPARTGYKMDNLHVEKPWNKDTSLLSLSAKRKARPGEATPNVDLGASFFVFTLSRLPV